MTNTPKGRLLEQNEMQRHYHDFVEPRIATLSATIIPEHNAGTAERTMHEAFCCKKTTILYCESGTGDEVALISHITPTIQSHLKPTIIVSRLRIENEILEAKLPDPHSLHGC
jgi:hypothetical protein